MVKKKKPWVLFSQCHLAFQVKTWSLGDIFEHAMFTAPLLYQPAPRPPHPVIPSP